MIEPQPSLRSCSFNFDQEGNCISDKDDFESIDIEFVSDLGIDNSDGQGFFVIKTDKWSVNDENDLKVLFDRIKQILIKP